MLQNHTVFQEAISYDFLWNIIQILKEHSTCLINISKLPVVAVLIPLLR